MKKLLALFSGIACIALACSKERPWTEFELSIINQDADVLRVLSVADKADSMVLRQLSSDLSAKALQSAEYQTIVRKLLATVKAPENDGVGIAGPQVGVLRRIVAVQRFDKEGEPFEVYPNISIVSMSDDCQEGREGCLSVPDRYGMVKRSTEVQIRYTSVNSLADTLETVSGFTAVIFQHECDHLDGVIYTDRLL